MKTMTETILTSTYNDDMLLGCSRSSASVVAGNHRGLRTKVYLVSAGADGKVLIWVLSRTVG